MVTTTVVGGAAVQGQPVGVDGLEQGAEGLAAALVGRHPAPVGLVDVACVGVR